MVKELVFERLNIPPHQQRLLYKGKALAGTNKDCLYGGCFKGVALRELLNGVTSALTTL